MRAVKKLWDYLGNLWKRGRCFWNQVKWKNCSKTSWKKQSDYLNDNSILARYFVFFGVINCSILYKYINLKSCSKIVKNFNTKKANSHGKISIWMLKMLGPLISIPFETTLKSWLERGSVLLGRKKQMLLNFIKMTNNLYQYLNVSYIKKSFNFFLAKELIFANQSGFYIN